MQGESNIRIDESYALKSRNNIVKLRSIRFEELTAHGNVIEEVLDLEVAAHGTGDRFLRHHLGGSQSESCAYLVIGHTCCKFHLRHCGNGRQRLATETHGVEGKEVVGLPDFRRGVALEGQAGVGL